MKISLIGYGKMGKIIEQIALRRNHSISYKISQSNQQDIQQISPANTDVVIEFTQPEAALQNIKACLHKQVPVVCGTTGWLEAIAEVETLSIENNTAFLHASNFSIGVNIFFKVNEILAKLMETQPQYAVGIEEIHHLQKKDAPSGTAIVLAEGIIRNIAHKTTWKLEDNSQKDKVASRENTEILPITALRLPEVPGTHTIRYTSTQDSISLTHEAHSREGFALGAVIAAEWLQNKKGNFTMQDVITW
jgi:4-hydroxy-tetrahydrodipicolinate reductase